LLTAIKKSDFKIPVKISGLNIGKVLHWTAEYRTSVVSEWLKIENSSNKIQSNSDIRTPDNWKISISVQKQLLQIRLSNTYSASGLTLNRQFDNRIGPDIGV
jgi:hypothetical protein